MDVKLSVQKTEVLYIPLKKQQKKKQKEPEELH